MGSRVINDDMLKRVYQAESVIYNWMSHELKDITSPEECFEELVKEGYYEYNSKNKAHSFREDLRNLRDHNMLDIFSKINISQVAPYRPWIIQKNHKGNSII